MTLIKLSCPLLLASNSPRRQEILTLSGFEFSALKVDFDESYSDDILPEKVAKTLSENKFKSIKSITKNEIIICADTVVICDDNVLNKPTSINDAKSMLRMLSGKKHKVITGVFISTPKGNFSFDDTAIVTFKDLDDWEIDFYIQNWQPFDKAGSYGIQEFIGMIGIERIEGSYYTIMGLPIQKVYEILKQFIIKE